MSNNSRQKKPNENGNSALGFEATLWATADKLRGNLDAAEYKHAKLDEQFAESAKLEKGICGN